MEERLAAALELDRRLTLAAATDVADLPRGWEVRHRALARVYHLNALLLPAPLPADVGAPELVALAEGRQADLEHRRLVLDDADAAERLAPALIAAGWERDRTLYMALRSDPAAALDDPRARRLSEAELHAAQLATLAEEDYGPHTFPGLAHRLADAQAALRAGTPAVGFGAGAGVGELIASTCTLYCDEKVAGRPMALIDTVGTLRAHRQQGLARAVVSAAVRAAGEWGAGLIVVPADADDWPQLLYASLGFAPLGRQVTLTRRAPSGSGWGGQ